MGSSNLEAAMINMLVSRVAEMSKYFGKILEAKDEKAKVMDPLKFLTSIGLNEELINNCSI